MTLPPPSRGAGRSPGAPPSLGGQLHVAPSGGGGGGGAAALAPRRLNVLAVALVVVGLLAAVGAGIYGYVESRRVETVVIAMRPIMYGQQITADDLGVVELPYYRPKQLQGVTSPEAVVGRYATRTIGANDLLQPSMISPDPPDTPVYPNGRPLSRNMVATAFSLSGVGPVTDRDFLNIGFIAADPTLCDRARAEVAPGTVLPATVPLVETGQARAYACRWMSKTPILYIDGDIAYLELTPAQAHALRALQAAGVALWAERYGASSEPLQFMDRLDAAQVILPDLTRPVTETLRVEPWVGERVPIPGSGVPIPGAPPTAAPSDRENEGAAPESPAAPTTDVTATPAEATP